MPHIIFESDNSESVRNLITAGLGIGFWPKYSWGSLSTDNVVLVPIACPDCTREIIITFKKNSEKQALIDDFYHYVANFIRDLETSRQEQSGQAHISSPAPHS